MNKVPLKTRLIRIAMLLTICGMGVLWSFSPVFRNVLLAIVMNPTIIMTAIGLYPLLVLVQVHRKRLRFNLSDLCATILSFGWTLVPLDYLLQKAGYPLREYPVFFLYVEVMLGIGFLSALKKRNMLKERVVALRWLIFVATLTAPATVVPALLGIVGMLRSNELFRNDWLAMLSWLALVAPVLIDAWFSVIRQVTAAEAKEKNAE